MTPSAARIHRGRCFLARDCPRAPGDRYHGVLPNLHRLTRDLRHGIPLLTWSDAQTHSTVMRIERHRSLLSTILRPTEAAAPRNLASARELTISTAVLRVPSFARDVIGQPSLSAVTGPVECTSVRVIVVWNLFGSSEKTMSDKDEKRLVRMVDVSSDLRQSPHWLTQSERECLVLLSRGKSVGEIAALLGASIRETERNLTSLYCKLGTRTRIGTIMKAKKLGLIKT